jgi:phosphatidylserine/phosphatidylglycerophosphate/cardiolipin synthase-like enzyme
MRRNYELNLLVVDPATGQGMRAMFDRDLEKAQRIERETWAQRPRWQRIAERGARLFAPDL